MKVEERKIRKKNTSETSWKGKCEKKKVEGDRKRGTYSNIQIRVMQNEGTESEWLNSNLCKKHKFFLKKQTSVAIIETERKGEKENSFYVFPGECFLLRSVVFNLHIVFCPSIVCVEISQLKGASLPSPFWGNCSSWVTGPGKVWGLVSEASAADSFFLGSRLVTHWIFHCLWDRLSDLTLSPMDVQRINKSNKE